MILNLGERNPFKPLELTKGAAWEWTATEKVWSTAGTQTINEQDWSLAYSGDAYYGYEGPNNGDRGLQFGSKNALASSVTLSSSFGNAYGIDEIVVNAACAKDSDAKLKVSVNGKNFLCENVMSVSLTQSATEYTFKSSELLAGDIVITLSQTTKKAMYLKSIFINPVEKTQLATPTNIVAAVDENIKNKINVSWDAVENAGSYVVSCGDLDPVTTTTPSASFENLTWSTDYKFSVVAKPSASDVEHLDSDMGESDVVSVGENPAPYMELSTNKEEVAADATSASFAVKSNVDWTVSTDASWVTLGTTSGSNDGTVALSFTANAGAADRTATVTVGSADATISRTYTLVQKKVGGSEKTETISGTFTSSNSELSLITTSGITLVQAKGSGNAVGGSYNTPSTLRIYKGNTLTFSGKAITKIEIVVKGKYYGNSLTANLGTLTPTTTSGGTIIWEGESNSVTITNVAKTDNVQLRPASIRVTYLE